MELNVSTPESGGSLRLRMRSCIVAVLAEGWAFTAHRDSREVSQGMQRRPVSCGSRFCSFGSTLFDILLRSFFASSLFHLVCCGMLWHVVAPLRWLSIPGEASSNPGFFGSGSTDKQGQERLLHASTGCNQQGPRMDPCAHIVHIMCAHVRSIFQFESMSHRHATAVKKKINYMKLHETICLSMKLELIWKKKQLLTFSGAFFSARSCGRCRKAKRYFRSTTNM